MTRDLIDGLPVLQKCCSLEVSHPFVAMCDASLGGAPRFAVITVDVDRTRDLALHATRDTAEVDFNARCAAFGFER